MSLGEAWPLVFILGPIGVVLGGCVITLIALGIIRVAHALKTQIRTP